MCDFKNGVLKLPRRYHACLIFFLLFAALSLLAEQESSASTALAEKNSAANPIIIATIDGSINPATNDYLKTSLKKAEEKKAVLFILKLNTPGGLLNSMQTMVASLLEAKIPTVVYVAPSGGGAISAGVFITLAGNFAVMAPGTNIGAAHPVLGSGEDVKGHMGEKVENFTVSLIKAIAEQRGRNIEWAEKAVRESVAITDREALQEKVIDFIASDIDKLLGELEGKTVTVKGEPFTLSGLAQASQEVIEMSFKQKVINILSDPNIAILLGLGALLGIGIELYNPGSVLPGVLGAICLVLALTASQVVPISYGGLALLLLGFCFFVIELFLPSFGIWGGAGIVCLVIGSIYFVDTDMVWGAESFVVDKMMVGSVAVIVGFVLLAVCYLAMGAMQRQVTTGKEGLIGKTARVRDDFVNDPHSEVAFGRVEVMGELWKARFKCADGGKPPLKGEAVSIVQVEGLELLVERR